ncbi:hypothetical protein [Bdellovibrio sp. HCB-162]|uniref:hypothetical protein n=1 Tax=Bdellovibrio sp. HCB-162 TaxID=3394234 RepID=UPI0039BCD435
MKPTPKSIEPTLKPTQIKKTAQAFCVHEQNKQNSTRTTKKHNGQKENRSCISFLKTQWKLTQQLRNSSTQLFIRKFSKFEVGWSLGMAVRREVFVGATTARTTAQQWRRPSPEGVPTEATAIPKLHPTSNPARSA